MKITGPAHPATIARLSGAGAPSRAARPAPARDADTAGRVARVNTFERALNLRASRLVAAVVPGSIDFSGADPAPKPDVLPFYRRPADRVAAATTLRVGKRLDITA